MMAHIDDLRVLLGGVSTPMMRGDNLSITLCGAFDNPDQDNDETGWTPDAIAGCNATLDAIHAHYAAEIARLSSELQEARRKEIKVRWEGDKAHVGLIGVGRISKSSHRDIWYALDGTLGVEMFIEHSNEDGFPSEPEARARVEQAAIAALGGREK